MALLRYKANRGVHPSAKVAHGATISSEAAIGPNAAIGSKAQVSGNAYCDGTLMNEALVSGSAMVEKNVSISDQAMVSGEAHLSGYLMLFGGAHVSDCAVVSGEVRLEGECRVGGHARVTGDDIVVRGLTCIAGNAVISQEKDPGLRYQDLTLNGGVFTRNCSISSSRDFVQITYENVLWTCYRTNKFGVYDITCDHDAQMLDGVAPIGDHGGANYFPVPEFVQRFFNEWQAQHLDIDRERYAQDERDELEAIARTEVMLEHQGGE